MTNPETVPLAHGPQARYITKAEIARPGGPMTADAQQRDEVERVRAERAAREHRRLARIRHLPVAPVVDYNEALRQLRARCCYCRSVHSHAFEPDVDTAVCTNGTPRGVYRLLWAPPSSTEEESCA